MYASADGSGSGAQSIDGVPLESAAWDTSAGENTSDPSGERAPTPPTRDRASILNALAAVVVDLERLLADKSRDALAQPAQDGGWGMVEIVPHMRDWEEINHERVALVLNEDRPVLESLDDSLWSIEHDYSAQDPLKVFEQFRELRADLVVHVSDLPDDAWTRTAVLEDEGEITLHWLLDAICARDATHLAQARDVLV